MDTKGRWMDTVMIERLWRSLKYASVYLHAFETGSEVRKGIEKWIRRYNEERPHSSLDDMPYEADWNLPKPGCPGKLAAWINGGFYLKSAPKLPSQWGPPLR